MLDLESLMLRILTRFPSLSRKELNLKYADTNDWIDLPADDLDLFIDMIERENLRDYWTQNVGASSNATTNYTETSSLFAIAKLRENVEERTFG